MQRLVFICPDVAGGVRTYISNLSSFLIGKDISHLILCYGYKNGIKGNVAEGDLRHCTRIGFSEFGSARSSYKLLASFIQRDDILICNDALELAMINDLKLKNKVVFILHGDLEHYSAILTTYHKIIDTVLCVSNGLKDKYSKLYPGLSFGVCHPLVANFGRAVEKGPEEGLVGVFVGRFEYMKGADVLVNIINSAGMKANVRWRIFTTKLGSDTKLMEALPDSVEVQYDLPNEQTLEEVGKADFLLFPSRSEGFGIAVLEAMKRGVIPIARNLPIGIPDMIIDGKTGYLKDKEDDIREVIEELNADPVHLKAMKLQVMTLSNDTFDLGKMGDRFLEKLREISSVPSKEKVFFNPEIRRIENILPEFVYRIIKSLYSTIKYARK